MAYKEKEEKAELSPEAVRQQVDRVLAHPLFNQSKRFERFLRHGTELALGSEPRVVSERDLGIDLFHRTSNYDTEADPIVRVTASEIRKRLAKYYAEPAHADEIRIELQKGSYVPEFHPVPRMIDSPTGKPALFAGGFSNWGTDASAAFLTSPDRMQAAFANAPPDWPRRNVQIVLETTVLRAQSGAPRVLAVHVW